MLPWWTVSDIIHIEVKISRNFQFWSCGKIFCDYLPNSRALWLAEISQITHRNPSDITAVQAGGFCLFMGSRPDCVTSFPLTSKNTDICLTEHFLLDRLVNFAPGQVCWPIGLSTRVCIDLVCQQTEEKLFSSCFTR